jgi:hypothetical protein
MIDTTEINSTLLSLDRYYLACRSSDASNKTLNFYCKLAVIELSGWIENTMDNIIHQSANRTKFSKEVQDILISRVKRNHGFHFADNFLPLLLLLIGTRNYETLNKEHLNSPQHSGLQDLLSNLKKLRDSCAHTHLQTDDKQIQTPSSLRDQLKTIADGLSTVDAWLRNNGH